MQPVHQRLTARLIAQSCTHVVHEHTPLVLIVCKALQGGKDCHVEKTDGSVDDWILVK